MLGLTALKKVNDPLVIFFMPNKFLYTSACGESDHQQVSTICGMKLIYMFRLLQSEIDHHNDHVEEHCQ